MCPAWRCQDDVGQFVVLTLGYNQGVTVLCKAIDMAPLKLVCPPPILEKFAIAIVHSEEVEPLNTSCPHWYFSRPRFLNVPPFITLQQRHIFCGLVICLNMSEHTNRGSRLTERVGEVGQLLNSSTRTFPSSPKLAVTSTTDPITCFLLQRHAFEIPFPSTSSSAVVLSTAATWLLTLPDGPRVF